MRRAFARVACLSARSVTELPAYRVSCEKRRYAIAPLEDFAGI
ncbi:hypothetical protein SAMD00079811_34100 [Scytonema sp. HK-05]|nr:hypothetical protein [Scytonema sp. HK-05]BAY45803.1 hypothetical protein SAMD00079811_34100 [Scytonema sp. HK-05]